MADALIAPAVAGTMYLCSGAAAGYSVKKVRQLPEPGLLFIIYITKKICI